MRGGEIHTNGTSDSTTNLGDEQDDSRDHRYIEVAYTGLSTDGGCDGSETTTDSLEELGPDDLGVGGVSSTRVDHEARAEETNCKTGGEKPLKSGELRA